MLLREELIVLRVHMECTMVRKLNIMFDYKIHELDGHSNYINKVSNFKFINTVKRK